MSSSPDQNNSPRVARVAVRVRYCNQGATKPRAAGIVGVSVVAGVATGAGGFGSGDPGNRTGPDPAPANAGRGVDTAATAATDAAATAAAAGRTAQGRLIRAASAAAVRAARRVAGAGLFTTLTALVGRARRPGLRTTRATTAASGIRSAAA